MGELPFTIDQFLQVFETYNQSVWPAQLIAYLFGASLLLLVLKTRGRADKYINWILGLFWIWMGVVYHILFFTEINPAAYIFGILFVIQGLAFVFLKWIGVEFRYAFRKDAFGVIGGLLILYAMIVYPLLGYSLGHIYPQAPIFGVAPCPTTIFTFGVLLWTKDKVPYWLLIIPGLWSVIGFSAAFQLTIYEDMGLVVAGISGVALLLYRNRRLRTSHAYSK